MDYSPIWLTLRLAAVSTLLLIIFCTPLAWWLSQSQSRWRSIVSAIVTLPLVLPPTVLGFYLLLALGPHGPIGKLTSHLGLGYLAFSFPGLVIGSIFYSLPFVVQPLENAFLAIGKRPIEVAATLRAGPIDRFFTIIIPQAKTGFMSAAILGFAHTLGEFGVVLMIGGNIPGETRVLSIAIYHYVETLQYSQAHWLAGGLVLFSFLILWFLQVNQRKFRLRQ
ncbi:MAG: molybdate ABC transporter permease subunit [Oligoflexus sp.]